MTLKIQAQTEENSQPLISHSNHALKQDDLVREHLAFQPNLINRCYIKTRYRKEDLCALKPHQNHWANALNIPLARTSDAPL